jgi:hypothetical protein
LPAHRRRIPQTQWLLLGAAITCGLNAQAAEPTSSELETQFSMSVRPFVNSYCASCHGSDTPKAQLDLTQARSLESVIADFGHWEAIREQLATGQMPPDEAKVRPTDDERREVIGWIQAVRAFEAKRHAGDPGVVLARRLSNAEFDNTIRDLTGVDLKPTREFPVDPANQAGFDNSGESLTMSPALMKKYLQAARSIADHLVLKPDGFDFASHPVLAETDRDKYGILRIVDFYRRQPTDYADYLEAAWRYRHRSVLGQPEATLDDIATESKISRRYLQLVWETLTTNRETVGPVAALQSRWDAMPQPNAGTSAVRRASEELRDWITQLRAKVACRFPNLQLKGVSSGGQCFILWKNRQYASHRRRPNLEALEVGGVPRPRPAPLPKSNKDKPREPLPPADPDPDLFVPENEEQRAPYVAGFERFCDVFPDAFYIAERGRMHLDRPEDKGRLLSAGFHNMMGYFRDDAPLMDLILDDAGRAELDRLWLDFDYVASVPERQHAEFIFYERAESSFLRSPEFDFARSEDKDVTSETKVQKLAEAYSAKATRLREENGGDPLVLEVIAEHFRLVNAKLREMERVRRAAEPTHLDALLRFATRAYRRPLHEDERQELLGFYRQLRTRDALSHEDAIRDCVVSVLLSPYVSYRVDLAEAGGETIAIGAHAEWKVAPLSATALASRLSYFLWASLPDDELAALGASGELTRPEVLRGQVRRMLREPQVRGLAVEFGGNWLDFRRFEEHNAVDRNRFPAFNDELRQAMFEEPVRFLVDALQSDRPVTDLLNAEHTFVNPPLARHYGIAGVDGPFSNWVRIPNAVDYGRGGLLPMAVFQTKNAPGLRTSPVKRGYWVVRRLLGEEIPPPPPVVPDLPSDEAQLGDLTLREVLARHRADRNCAACHARFDSFGLVFEGFGPIGERRDRDLGGRLVDAAAPFPDDTERTGVEGLKEYIRSRRQADFVDQVSRQLLAYALGRTLVLSDEPTIEALCSQVNSGEPGLASLVEAIVMTPQFLNKRVPVETGMR